MKPRVQHHPEATGIGRQVLIEGQTNLETAYETGVASLIATHTLRVKVEDKPSSQKTSHQKPTSNIPKLLLIPRNHATFKGITLAMLRLDPQKCGPNGQNNENLIDQTHCKAPPQMLVDMGLYQITSRQAWPSEVQR